MNFQNQLLTFPQCLGNQQILFYFVPTLNPNCQNLIFPINQNVEPIYEISPCYELNHSKGGEQEEENNTDTKKTKQTRKTRKEKLEGSKLISDKKSSATRNIKATILKDFLRSIQRDAFQVLFAKQVLNSKYSINKFAKELGQIFPSEEKYVSTKAMINVCWNHEDKEFMGLLRVMIRNFLKGEYIKLILLKRKNKLQCLKGCRQLIQKLQKHTISRKQ